MTQHELNCEVAQATGESVATVAGRGFVLLTVGPVEHEPFVVDWDALTADRSVAISPMRRREVRSFHRSTPCR